MFARNRLVLLTGALFVFLSLAHLPDAVFPHGFDKNAPVQLTVLVAITSLMAVFIFVKRERFAFELKPVLALYLLVAALVLSSIFSGNFINSLTGEAGRFTGVVSVLALILVAIFHTQFSFDQFRKLIYLYLLGVVLIGVFGLLQHFKVMTFPGAAGVSSTLGNPDFVAAMLGTSTPLFFYLALSADRVRKVILVVGLSINLFCLYFAGPLQAYVDIAITLIGIALYLLRSKLARKELTLNVKTFLGTLGVIIWAEGIFLVPFIGKFIPVLGNDPQVEIRSQFWLAGTNQFFKEPVFGVGPDNYGNYYEQTRTLADATKFQEILSSDAHSASVQTLATLGFFGTAAFILLIAFLVRSFFILDQKGFMPRKELYALALFVFVYLTNSFVSPITLPNKYLLWAVAGFVVGNAYRTYRQKRINLVFPLVIASVITSLFVTTNLVRAEINWLTHVEQYAEDNSRKIDYKANPYLPCNGYFDVEYLMSNWKGSDSNIELAQERLESNERCAAARILILRESMAKKDYVQAKAALDVLLIHTPSRVEVLKTAMEVGEALEDVAFQQKVFKQLSALGLIYVPPAQP